MNPGLVIEQLRVRAGRFFLEDLSLEVPQGAYFIVLGPTGSGKTVFLETIAGLRRPLSGRISISGRDITWLPPERRRVGFVYQDYALFPHLRVRENIAFGLRLRKGGRREASRKIQEVCGLLGIEHLRVGIRGCDRYHGQRLCPDARLLISDTDLTYYQGPHMSPLTRSDNASNASRREARPPPVQVYVGYYISNGDLQS